MRKLLIIWDGLPAHRSRANSPICAYIPSARSRSMPKSICTYPNCRALIPRKESRCPLHPYEQRRAPDDRASARTRGYDHAWEKLRAWYLTRQPVCEMRYESCTQVATMVDHIIPIADGGKRLDQDNLQSGCRSCHRVKTFNDQNRGRGEKELRSSPDRSEERRVGKE